MKAMSDPVRKIDRPFTYGDYRTWPDDERWELIDGVAWNMSPAPNRRHQSISINLAFQISRFLNNTPDARCKLYAAPFDVLLPDLPDQEEDDVPTVVQPDLVVFCDPSRLTDKGATGAPDWVIEILSPWTSKKDFHDKLSLYERHVVREYWIIDPAARYLHVYRLDAGGHYPTAPEVHLEKERVPSGVLAGLVVELEKAFTE
jgi:Uma2 family endonuclease